VPRTKIWSKGAVAFAAMAGLAGLTAGANAAALKVTSTAFAEGGIIAAKYAGHMVLKRGATEPTDCGGDNVTPPLTWTNVPAGTKSFALVIFDPDGAKGSGAVHWVAYGIAGTLTGLPEGFGSHDSADFVGGTGTAGNHTYNGPCPIPGHTNHYVFSVYALDLDPTALPPGLRRDQLFTSIKDHVLEFGSIVGRAPSRQRSGPGMEGK
jgi:Raf kinase inhibitor-like YbhB/YbcL family protein